MKKKFILEIVTFLLLIDPLDLWPQICYGSSATQDGCVDQVWGE